MSSAQSAVIAAIAEANASSFTTVKQSKVSDEDIIDTQIPMLIISQVGTGYAQPSGYRSLVEEYSIWLMIILTDSDTPLVDLADKQDELITNLYDSPTLNSIILKESLVLLESSISNTVTQYKGKRSVINCVLRISCKVGSDY